MGWIWETPKWQQQGRTGPGGPQYASRRNRNRVRAGKPVPGPKKGSGGASGATMILAAGIYGGALIVALLVAAGLAHGYGAF